MNTTAVFLIAMLNQGHWIGGQPATVALQTTIEMELPAAIVKWQFAFGPTRLAEEQRTVPAGAKESTIEFETPEVRVTTEAQLIWSVRNADSGQLIAEGRETLHLYPKHLLAKVTDRLQAKSLAVWDKVDGLPALLEQARIPFARIDNESALRLSRYDILIVAADQMVDRPFGQAALLSRVENGMAALVLRQTRVKALAGYPLRRRPAAASLAWRKDQILLEHLGARRLPEGQDCWAIALPAEEPALELVYWPPQVAVDQPVPIDALVVRKTLGRGQIVFCQIPLGAWAQDPISQLFLVDAIDHLTGRAEPTPTPSRRARLLPAADTRPQILSPTETPQEPSH